MPHPSGDEFEHDRIVDQANDLEMIGDQIIRITEIDQRGQGLAALGSWQIPILVFEQHNQALNVNKPLAHVAGKPINANGIKRLLRRIDDIDLVGT